MVGYETGSMENDPTARVCEHGQLKRKCEVCSEWKPRALEAEARVAELETSGTALLDAYRADVEARWAATAAWLQAEYERRNAA